MWLGSQSAECGQSPPPPAFPPPYTVAPRPPKPPSRRGEEAAPHQAMDLRSTLTESRPSLDLARLISSETPSEIFFTMEAASS